MKDGIYFELFAVKDGVRYDAKIIELKEVGEIMANSLTNGLGKIIGVKETDYSTEKGGEQE